MDQVQAADGQSDEAVSHGRGATSEARRWLLGSMVAGSFMLVLSSCSGATPSAEATSPGGSAPLIETGGPGATHAAATPAATPEFNSSTVAATSAPDGAVTVEMAGPPPHYVPRMVIAKAGDVVIYLDNTSQGIHTLAIDRVPLHYNGDRVTNVPLVVSDAVRYRSAATFTVEDLPAGTYYIWCTIDNHAAEGMTGTLTLNP